MPQSHGRSDQINMNEFLNHNTRQSKKETAKEALIQEEKQDLLRSIQELALKIEQQDAQMRHLERTVAALDSRKWLPRLKILSRDDKSDDGSDGAKPKATDVNNNDVSGKSNVDADIKSANSSVSAATQIGNYNPNAGILFKSLNLIETEIFYSEPAAGKGRRIIEDALVYLKYNAYE